ncbi:MAG TPA: HAD family hydrolase [Kosmotogaceae bacterium]|nr:MAG: HAD-superfamily hydrolase, subfamily IIA [Thermotogales bacterium 46_20]HAA85261.1 HAD family hydrolase [Kosmotogaceae bacterium]
MNLNEKKLFVMDMDGTFYLGHRLLLGALEVSRMLHARGKHLVFLTNNSSETPQYYTDKLVRLGVKRKHFEVYTSGEATISFLKSNYPGSRVFLLAVPSVRVMFEDAGVCLSEDDPNVAVITYDKTIDFDKLTRFCGLVRDGVTYIASHPDINCPTEDGPIPDVGSFMELIKASTGRRADHIVGKPNPEILKMLMKDYGVREEETVMIGDRIYTDMECARKAGVESILVLSGETTSAMVPEDHDYLVIDDISSLVSKI